MNKRLQKAVDRARANYWAKILIDGNFTVALLFDDEARTNLISFGISKRNPNCHNWDEVIGQEIAYVRAVKKLMVPKRKKAK